VTINGKISSLLQYGNNYYRKRFYSSDVYLSITFPNTTGAFPSKAPINASLIRTILDYKNVSNYEKRTSLLPLTKRYKSKCINSTGPWGICIIKLFNAVITYLSQ
jgi:hypothetical protein